MKENSVALLMHGQGSREEEVIDCIEMENGMVGKYANVIVDISHEKVDRPFQYRIPEHLRKEVEAGMQVVIPFGRGNREINGFVLEVTDEAEFEEDRMKDILSVKTDGVTMESKMIQLAWWMKYHYGSTMNNALKTVLPVKVTAKKKEIRMIECLVSNEELLQYRDTFLRKHQVAKVRVIDALLDTKEVSFRLLSTKLNIAKATILSMEKEGILRQRIEENYRNPIRFQESQPKAITLSEKQQSVVDAIDQDMKNQTPGVYLLHGITGSGKTEVYIECIRNVLAMGKQAIVLIPEIALTYQTVMRFYRQFGDRVSVMNSRLTPAEKADQMERARQGEIDVIIGPRSALFTPFSNLGFIIIDEEHENSYKSETMPKYHAREVAKELARMNHAGLLLGSATPSMDSYYKAKNGEIRLFTLTERLTGGTLPTVSVVDLREELKKGNRSMFSLELQENMKECLAKKEQIMLFLNRRGYAGFISCRECGEVMKCPHCDVSLSEHYGGTLVCHYCGFEQPKMTKCPKCGSKYVLGFRAGTEQVEQTVKKMFPQARVLRMDADVTKKKDSYEEILSAFANQEADILIGTQMIVKGHDFPMVTLVGILAADMSLAVSDYRAGERTFQLLTQAAGRAGRGTKAGRVVIQTYQPDHYSIVHAAEQDYEGFYEEEILYREFLSYPPAGHMMAVQILSPHEINCEKLAKNCAMIVQKYVEDVIVIGPAKAAIGKINDVYRYVFYCKSPKEQNLIQSKDYIEQYVKRLGKIREMVYFDFDPMNAF